MNTEITLHSFIQSYWNYFLELEEQLISTKKFVDFGKQNNKTFSIEYLKLLQATCSEIDVVAKILAKHIDDSFNINKCKSIQKWEYTILCKYPELVSSSMLFNNDYAVSPWKNFGCEKYQDKNNQTRYRLIKGKKTPEWWNAYNKLKHGRTYDYENNEINYVQANLKNLVSAMAALYSLEKLYLSLLEKEENTSLNYKNSILFTLQNEEVLTDLKSIA